MNLILNCSAIIVSFALMRIEALDSQDDAGSSNQFLSPCEKSDHRDKQYHSGKIDGLNIEFADCGLLQRRMADVVPIKEPTLPPNFPPVDIQIPIGLAKNKSPIEESSPVDSALP